MTQLAAHAAPRPFTVVIDPGHGGTDRGTTLSDGRYTLAEKDVALLLAHDIATELKGSGINTFLTRTQDREMSLPERTAIANRKKADIFLSVHLNSASDSHRSDAQGIETYILNRSTDATSRRLAKLENSVLEGSAAKISDQTDVDLIVKDLLLDSTLSESKQLACLVQHNLVTTTSTPRNRAVRDRGVKQALFYVLLGADMPSILVEAGFLNHPGDRSLLLSPSGRKRVARGIAQAVTEQCGFCKWWC
jgi:N-acetylmuramoyl-L-alanine amidase